MEPTDQRGRRQINDPEATGTSPPEDIYPAVEITEDYQLELGNRFTTGAYADIYTATMIRPGGRTRCEVAVKVLRYHGTMASSQQYEQSLLRIDKRLSREMRLWGQLKHRRITPLLAYAKSASKIFPKGGAVLISPYRENANPRTYLSKNPNVDKLLLLQQVCEGLNYMHTFEPPIAHLDLKPENVLINDNHEAELCDFGLAEALEDVETGFTTSTIGTGGTLIYMSPEALNGGDRTTTSDIYSMGSIILDVLSGIPPWGETPRDKVTLAIARGRTPPREQHIISEYDPDVVVRAWALMERCWSLDPQARPESHEVLDILGDLHNRASTTKDNPVDRESGLAPLHREDIASASPDDSRSSLHFRNDGTAERDELSATIERHRKALELHRPGHPQRDRSLHKLAQALVDRYNRDKNLADLSAAIELGYGEKLWV